MPGSKTTLVNDLRGQVNTIERDTMINRAMNGYYHCFESMIPFPKIQLRKDLLDLGYHDLAKKVLDGAYDDEAPKKEN